MSIRLEHVNYIYSPNTAYEKQALRDVNLEIPHGQFVGVIGHTGSGKSTLIQHFNGLMKATSGSLYYDNENIYDETYNMKALRNQVGLVFQYPEHQLFEIDALTDVCFGPKNQGLSTEECKKRARKALQLVGYPEELYEQSPFELSGGQKRRVAIAGVLAMEPKVLVLDEPTAGLDPRGRDEILDQVAQLHKECDMTVILVSHSMEDIAKYVDRIIVMNDGEVMYDDEPKQVFSHYKELEKVGLAAPQVTYIMHELQEKGIPVSVEATTVEAAADEIMRVIRRDND
ncbi:energy-coupling factor transporter ATPase [Lachnospiraceae bacterium LCP25S3_G4]